MAEVKKVSDQYTISVPVLVIDGNLTIQGTTTTVDTINSTLSDNIVVFNDGETAAGITAGSSGFEIDRGLSENVSFVYEESESSFSAKIGESLTTIRVATPTEDTHSASKQYVDTSIASSFPGSDTQVIFNDSGVLSGSSEFTWDGFNLNVGDTTINSGSIFSNISDSDLELYANGSGDVYLTSALRWRDVSSDPASIPGDTHLYSKSPGDGGTGLYFNNQYKTDELISKTRAVLYGLIL